MHLMFAVEAQNMAPNCNRYCLIDNKFQKCPNILRSVAIATWLIYPYPDVAIFHIHLNLAI